MYKRIVIGVGIVVGVLAIAVPIAASLNWAKKQNLAEQQRRVDRAASEVLRRMDLMADEAFEMFSLMKAAKATAPCSRQNIQLMRRIALQMGQLKAVGYVENNYMVCSSFGQHNATSKGIPLGPPSYRSPLGSEVRTSIRQCDEQELPCLNRHVNRLHRLDRCRSSAFGQHARCFHGRIFWANKDASGDPWRFQSEVDRRSR